jgi:putative membrane protein
MTAYDIPPINATLNATATVLITLGFIFIKTGRIMAHRRMMLTAAVVSALFLIGYVTYHGLQHGFHTEFGGQGAIRTVYLIILWTHIPLAALIAFLVPRTFLFAIKGDFVRHKAWAKWTFPIWYYVSVTGVLVYFFLYQWWPAAR